MSQGAQRRQGVTPELDDLSATLMGEAFDLLAEGEEMGVLLAVQDEQGAVWSYEFADDGPEACLEGARERVRRMAAGNDPQVSDPVRYAITYEGAIEVEDGSFADAVILEFGERGYLAFSAFSLIEGRGAGDGFAWTDPAPAGEMEPLL